MDEEGVEVHDFSADEEFIENPRFFFDPNHLNRRGAKPFSHKRLRPLLVE